MNPAGTELPKEGHADCNRRIEIRVCVGTGGLAAGALEVIEEFRDQLLAQGFSGRVLGRKCDCKVGKVGCRGFCAKDVLVDVEIDGVATTYQRVTAPNVRQIVTDHILLGRPVEKWLAGEEYEHFHSPQQKILLSECGTIDPEDIDAYIAVGGYEAIEKVVRDWQPGRVVEEIKQAGLRGRGGAGFPTGVKWELARAAAGDFKYLICNADEGDPGAFMDRSLLEGNPHAVIEGMLIGAWAIGAREGFVYVRAEYPLAVERLRIAIGQARERQYLGQHAFGGDFDFDVKIRLGAGAFVCGEETALIASLEDRIGNPRPKPPFPVVQGYRGMSTTINNVETWANVPQIIRHGATWFASHGTASAKGTKIFSLVGKIRNTGLVEVPMGMSLRTIVEDIGGGVPEGRTLKAVQTGGPSGGCIPASLIDTPADYESLTALGSIMGSGGMVVMDDQTCMVDVARFFLDFCREESCGQCTPCRDGTAQMVRLLEDICAGRGTEDHIAQLEELSVALTGGSLCGLGKTAANPVLSTLKYFRSEYEAHVRNRRCPAGVCKALITMRIDPQACTGCTLCALKCPEKGVISGMKKQPHSIDPERCTRCGICYDLCKFGAVIKE